MGEDIGKRSIYVQTISGAVIELGNIEICKELDTDSNEEFSLKDLNIELTLSTLKTKDVQVLLGTTYNKALKYLCKDNIGKYKYLKKMNNRKRIRRR